MAYAVTQRTQEFGIRLALGAGPSTILWSVLRRASLYLAAGLVIGVMAAWGLAGLVEGFLFEVQPHDLTVYTGVLTVLALTGLAAAFLPARRAARVDPLVALRME
jgi:ABC-type antimicrobial peptide transport system permease subunit